MNQVDIQEQWRRLQENYASLADEELEAIAREAYDLTDIARQALQAEISRRQLTIALRQSPATDEDLTAEEGLPTQEEGESRRGYPEGFDPEDWGLVSFSRVDDIEQARKLKSCFDKAGIPSYFGPDVVDDLRLLPASLKGSLEVKVRELDLGRARAVQNDCMPAPAGEDEGQAVEYSAYCPKCHSAEIVFQELDDSEAAEKFSWSCDACGYHWKDDGIESQS
jgi:DNA-directed RNA polymerase subunit M/transcription elongation factor TFIIS